MIIRPELEALRSDDTPQRAAQDRLSEALAHWRAAPAGVTVQTELARFDQGALLDDLPLLSALFTANDISAPSFCDQLICTILAELAEQPLGQAPLRYSADDTLTTVNVARARRATLCLQAIDGAGLARRPRAETVSFAPVETWEFVLAGAAQVELVTMAAGPADPADFAIAMFQLRAGQVHHRFGHRQVLVLRTAPTGLVSLKLQRPTSEMAVTRQYALAAGTLLHQAAGSARDSRLELSAALLGRMGRTEAAPMLAAMAEEQSSPTLRWQVLRECLALDALVGFGVLSRIARRTDDPLSACAAALRLQLLAQHPGLAQAESCLA